MTDCAGIEFALRKHANQSLLAIDLYRLWARGRVGGHRELSDWERDKPVSLHLPICYRAAQSTGISLLWLAILGSLAVLSGLLLCGEAEAGHCYRRINQSLFFLSSGSGNIFLRWKVICSLLWPMCYDAAEFIRYKCIYTFTTASAQNVTDSPHTHSCTAHMHAPPTSASNMLSLTPKCLIAFWQSKKKMTTECVLLHRSVLL